MPSPFLEMLLGLFTLLHLGKIISLGHERDKSQFVLNLQHGLKGRGVGGVDYMSTAGVN